jgi:hypothetical protein
MMNAVGAERFSVDRGIGVRPGDGDGDPFLSCTAHPQRQPAERHLDRGTIPRIGDQPIGQRV